MESAVGITLVAENPSASLNKISEIYDRIGFAGVGKYSEFENLRKAGIRYADLKGYAYSRGDVFSKSLANAYSEVIGNIFTREIKPLEVEILVVEVGETSEENQMYRILFDGSISDHHGSVVIGGQAEKITQFLRDRFRDDLRLEEAIKLGKEALEAGQGGPIRENTLEVAILDRARPGRKFRRFSALDLRELLAKASLGS
jgi:proteasome alpha subunit